MNITPSVTLTPDRIIDGHGTQVLCDNTIIMKPRADSTTALQIFKADGTTPVVAVDTANARVSINGTFGVTGISSFADGAANTPSMTFASDAKAGIFKAAAGFSGGSTGYIGFSGGGNGITAGYIGGNGVSTSFILSAESHINWTSGDASVTNTDTILWRAGAGGLGIKVGGTKAVPQPTYLQFSNYFADGGVNREFGMLGWSYNIFTISTYGYGDGVSEPMQFYVCGAIVYMNATNFMPSTSMELGRGDGDHRWSTVFAGKLDISGTGPGSKLSIVGLPTSAAGLSAGDIWSNGGILTIV